MVRQQWAVGSKIVFTAKNPEIIKSYEPIAKSSIKMLIGCNRRSVLLATAKPLETQAVLMSFFRTCKLRGIDPISFFADSVAAAIRTGALLPIPDSSQIAQAG
jgi:hypothetical protein